MRTRNQSATGALTVQAVAGTHVVLLGLDLPESACPGLLGFAFRREDHTESETYWLAGTKTFRSVEPHPALGLQFSTRKHPIQGFTWSDFTAKPDHDYTYEAIALRGAPTRPEEAERVKVRVRTETARERGSVHHVFFNRGAAASQEYTRRFGDRSPDQVGPAAFDWLSRGAAEALRDFIARATDASHGLHVLAYEFTDATVLEALKAAWQVRKVDVKVLYHALDDSQHRSNVRAIQKHALEPICQPRMAAGLALSHNKVIVLTKGGVAQAVLTGSTNFSEGGIYGHSNVVHICENDAVADTYLRLWNELSKNAARKQAVTALAVLTPLPPWVPRRTNGVDPGPLTQSGPDAPPLPVDAGDSSGLVLERAPGRAVPPVPPAPPAPPAAPAPDARAASRKGVWTVFSPRPNGALQWYADRAHEANDAIFATFAFGMDEKFQAIYQSARAPLRYALMEALSGPAPTPEKKAANVQAINALRELPANRFAVGTLIKDGAFNRWLVERLSNLNKSVRYVHTKYLLVDPLGDDPLVVSGSANFSDASTLSNDENMLVVRGDARVADIYLGEFMRLYNHFTFREWLAKQAADAADQVLFLDESGTWWQRYFGNTFSARQRHYFATSPSPAARERGLDGDRTLD